MLVLFLVVVGVVVGDVVAVGVVDVAVVFSGSCSCSC